VSQIKLDWIGLEYLCAKFDSFSFSRFGFIVQKNHRQNHRGVGVSKDKKKREKEKENFQNHFRFVDQ